MLAVLRQLPAAAFDGLLCDPPYGLGVSPCDRLPGFEVWEEVGRVLTPGAWLLVFGALRTHHQLMVSLARAGLEPCDVLCWLFGTPTWQPVVLARRRGPVRPLNIDASRLCTPVLAKERRTSPRGRKTFWGGEGCHPAGRWPANALFEHPARCTAARCCAECPVARLGQAWRYFYCPKPTGKEGEDNPHPARKPLRLCGYLAGLIKPVGQRAQRRLLVPYCGSGSELLGGLVAGWESATGIEQDARWLAVARERLSRFQGAA